MSGELRLHTPVQVALFEKEIKGQLSDGQWENSTPWEHWKPWSRRRAVVAAPGTPVGVRIDWTDYESEQWKRFGNGSTGYVPSRAGERFKYALEVLAANTTVRDRMLAIAHAAGADPIMYGPRELKRDLVAIKKAMQQRA